MLRLPSRSELERFRDALTALHDRGQRHERAFLTPTEHEQWLLLISQLAARQTA